jgi:cytochrome c peroxidase
MMSDSWRLASALMLLSACGGEPPPQDEPPPAPPPATLDDATVRALFAIPERLAVPHFPDANPPSAAKLQLGRQLFYDERLSGNGSQSCGTCHLQRLAFADGKRTPTGSTGQTLHRNSPGLQNVAYLATLTWASTSLGDLEAQIPVPIRGDDPVELGVSDGQRDEVLARFDADPAYRDAFSAAFPGSPSGATIDKIVLALATFCRSMISADSPFDRYSAGDREALTTQQRQGLALFNGERFECFHCHTGTNLTTSYRDRGSQLGSARRPFFNTGLYNVDGEGGYPEADQGLYDLTLAPRDRGLFRAPPLRNVALTAPYMHDGSIETLRDVVRHYAAGGRLLEGAPNAGDGRQSPLKSGLVRGFSATDEEIAAVVAFLEALTDASFVSNPAFSDPSPEPDAGAL